MVQIRSGTQSVTNDNKLKSFVYLQQDSDWLVYPLSCEWVHQLTSSPVLWPCEQKYDDLPLAGPRISPKIYTIISTLINQAPSIWLL